MLKIGVLLEYAAVFLSRILSKFFTNYIFVPFVGAALKMKTNLKSSSFYCAYYEYMFSKRCVYDNFAQFKEDNVVDGQVLSVVL